MCKVYNIVKIVLSIQFKPEKIDSIYDDAKLYYECGDYATASQYLNLHNELVPTTDKVLH